LTAAQIILIDRVVTKLGVIRCIEEHVRENSVMMGHDLAPALQKNYLAYNNSVRLDLQALGITTRQIGEPMDLGRYVEQQDRARAEKAAASAQMDADKPSIEGKDGQVFREGQGTAGKNSKDDSPPAEIKGRPTSTSSDLGHKQGQGER
jgi:hypothetical protein